MPATNRSKKRSKSKGGTIRQLALVATVCLLLLSASLMATTLLSNYWIVPAHDRPSEGARAGAHGSSWLGMMDQWWWPPMPSSMQTTTTQPAKLSRFEMFELSAETQKQQQRGGGGNGNRFVVDALGRPLASMRTQQRAGNSDRKAIAASNGGIALANAPRPATTTTTLASTEEERREVEECGALLQDSTLGTPAEPSLLARCKVLVQKEADIKEASEVRGEPRHNDQSLSSTTASLPLGEEQMQGLFDFNNFGVNNGLTDFSQGTFDHHYHPDNPSSSVSLTHPAGIDVDPSPNSNTLEKGERDKRHVLTDDSELPSSVPLSSVGGGASVASRPFSSSFSLSSAVAVPQAPPHTAASLRNEAERCHLIPNPHSPPVLLWRSKRSGGSTLAALLVRYAFVHKLQVAGPQGRMAHKACKQTAWRSSSALHPLTNASVSHWPFVCRPHEVGGYWGGLAHLFGGRRQYQEVLVARDPVARSVGIYYWLGRRPSKVRRLVGMNQAVTDPMQPPPIVKAIHYAKNLPEAFQGAGANSELPRWPWHAFAWAPGEALDLVSERGLFVVSLEHYDESLLALRRKLRWPMAEVLYTVERRGAGGGGEGSGSSSKHASWEVWPPGAIKKLKESLKKHGAMEFHEGCLKAWAKQIASLYPEGRESFNAELSLLRAATTFLKGRCESAENDLLDNYIANLIDRSKERQSAPAGSGAGSAEKGSGLEYNPPPETTSAHKKQQQRSGNAKKKVNAELDSAFTFGKAPLSITELCVRHQYCEHVKGKAKKLQVFTKSPPSPLSSSSASSGEAAQLPFPASPAALDLSPREEAQLARLKRGDAVGIEALAQLFI